MNVTRSKQKLRSAWLAGILLICSLGLLAAHPEVSLPGSDFEIDTDANLVQDDAAPSIDWATVDGDIKADLASGSGDDSFGQGSKEDTPVPVVVDGSIPPNKSDLLTFGVYLEDNASGRFLHMFWHRVQEPSGTTNMDFEFNQSSTISANGVTPVRTDGDLLIQYDLANGGTSPELFLSMWIDGSGGETKDDCEASNKLPCWAARVNLTSSGDATGSINTSAIASGNAVPELGGTTLGSISPRTFGEASIDFDAIVNGSTQCVSFGSAYLKSRSSDSFTAAMKDFIAPQAVNISNCGTVKITKVDDDSPANALAGAQFDLRNDNSPFGGSPGAEDDVVSSCTTDVNGMCTITNVFAGSYWVVETVAPTGHDLASPAYQLITVNTDAQTSVTFTDPRKPAKINIVKEDDAGAKLAGAQFTLFNDDNPENGSYDAGSDTSTGKTCTTDANGECMITNILPPGKYCVVETITPAGHDTASPQCVTLALDQTVTLTFVDNRQPAKINIVKEDDLGNKLAGAEFTLFNDDNPENGSYDSGSDTSTGKTCTTDVNGECMITNILPPGKYCVVETVTPANYTTAPPQCVTLALNQTVTLTFVDPRERGAIKITKTRKHAASGSGDHAHAGVTFSVGGGSLAVPVDVVTDANGEACVDNLVVSALVGDYTVTETVPSGYVAGSTNPQTVSVTAVGTCSTGTQAQVSFSNIPLTNVTVSVDSQVDGGTASTISCSGASTVNTGANGDGSITLLNRQPSTITCTIVIDP